MIKRLLFLLILFLTTVPVFSEEVDTAWVRTYSGTTTDMAVDGAGNVYVIGYDGDYNTIKYLPNGDTAWVRRYGGSSYERPNALAVDGAGNVYVTGTTVEAFSGYLTIKYLPNGDTAWVRRYDSYPGLNTGDSAHAIAVDYSGNVYVTGTSYYAATVWSYDYATIKYLPNGATVWARIYDGLGNLDDHGLAIAVDGAGNVYVTGSSWNGTWAEECNPNWGTSWDWATIKYLPNGDTAWVRRYDDPVCGPDEVSALAVDESGNVYVTGYTWSTTGNLDYLTIKYLPSGATAWVRTYNGPVSYDDQAYAIAVDGSGNAFVTGYSTGSLTAGDYATIKYYPNGDTAWVRRYDGPRHKSDLAQALALDDSGNVYVTGGSYSLDYLDSSRTDFATIKYLQNGDVAWVARYGIAQNSEDGATSIAVDDLGNVYVAGTSHSIGLEDYKCLTIKYSVVITGVAGTVKDADTQENLQDVLVEALQGGIVKGSDYSDIYGQYEIVDLTPGIYDVRASKSGYLTQTQTGKQVYTGQKTTVDFQLQQPASVAGTVKDAYTQENLQDVLVEALQGGVKGSDTTDIDGQYNIANLIPGTYDIRASKSGYVTQTQTGKQLIGGQTTTVDFLLTLPPDPLGDTALFFSAYSPVDLIVIDPNSDSIGVNFNTIPNAVYDTTTDRNHDGDLDDIVTIPNPLVGDYLVRVVAEPGADTGYYTLGIKMVGSSETIVVTHAEVPPPGEPDSVVYDVMEYLRGDANSDGNKSVSDVIYIINFLFKGGPTPNPLILGDCNCEGGTTVSDVIYLINYLFKGGPAPCS